MATCVTGVDRAGSFDEQGMYLFVGHGAVLNTTGHDEQLPRAYCDIAVAQPDGQFAADHEEQLIGVVVLVPHEFTMKLYDLDFVVIETGHYPR